MDLAIEFKKLQESQEQILQMLSEMDIYSNPSIELYTFDEIARMLKVTKRTIYNWKDQYLLPYILVGGKSYVSGRQLKSFLEDNEIKPVTHRRFRS